MAAVTKTSTELIFLKEKFKDTKGVLWSHKSNDRQYNGEIKKNKKTYNDLEKTTEKTKDYAKRTLLKTEVNSDAWKG